MWSYVTEQANVSKAGKVDSGDRVTLPVKFCL